MKIPKCDICSETFEPGELDSGFVRVKVQNSNHSSWTFDDVYDFCPDCMKKVEKFLKGD